MYELVYVQECVLVARRHVFRKVHIKGARERESTQKRKRERVHKGAREAKMAVKTRSWVID